MAIEQVGTLSDLKNVAGMTANEVRFMKGRASATGDVGAGIFEWHPTSDAAGNDGDVIVPNNWGSSSGRWIRQLDVRGPVHAEWFGALGDGNYIDLQAIQDCLATFGRVTLLARTYRIDGALQLKPGYVLEGQGMGLTTLKFVDGTTSATLSPVKNAASPNNHAHNAVIRDLTIDCWGASGSASSSFQAISLQGENILVERVEPINFRASKTGALGCIVIGVQNSDSKTRMGIIRDCLIQSPATNDGASPGALTCLSLLGQTAPSGSCPGLGGSISGNRILNLQFTGSSGSYRSQLQGIVYGQSIGLEVAENEIVDFDGAAIVSSDASEHDSTVRANRLLNVQAGIVIGDFSGTSEHLRTRVLDNLITLDVVDSQSSAIGALGFQAVYCRSAGSQNCGDYWIQRNFVQGSTRLSTVPRGIYLFQGWTGKSFRLVCATVLMCSILSAAGMAQLDWTLQGQRIGTGEASEPDLEYGNGRIVAQRAGIIYYSQEGSLWNATVYHSGNIAFGGGKFVALAHPSLESDDGVVWMRSSSDPPAVTVIGFGRGEFIAVGPSGVMGVFGDNEQWQARALDLGDRVGPLSLVFGRGRFVLSTWYALRTSTDLAGWPLTYDQGSSFTHLIRSVTFGGGLFLAAGEDGQVPDGEVLLTSTDGARWTKNERAHDKAPRQGLCYGSGVFAGGGPGGTLYVSTDGVNWGVTKLNTSSDFLDVVFAGGRFVAVARDGTVARSQVVPPHVTSILFRLKDSFRLPDGAMLLTLDAPYGQPVLVEASEDLTNWVKVARDPCDRGEFEVYDENAKAFGHRFYRARQAPPEIPDPLTQWTLGATVLENGENRHWQLAYGNGVLVAGGSRRFEAIGSAWFSTDGSNWQRSSTAPHPDVVFGNGTFVSWPTGPMTTTNGQNWALHQPEDLRGAGVGFGRGRFVALAHQPATTYPPPPRATWLASSTNGMSWETALIPGLRTTDGEALYAKGRIIFFDRIKIVSSGDEVTWQTGFELIGEVGEYKGLMSLAYGAGRFIATGYDSRLATYWFGLVSDDGVSWTREGAREPISPLIWANGTFVGGNGDTVNGTMVIYRSEDSVNWSVADRLPMEWSVDGVREVPTGFAFAEGRFYF